MQQPLQQPYYYPCHQVLGPMQASSQASVQEVKVSLLQSLTSFALVNIHQAHLYLHHIADRYHLVMQKLHPFLFHFFHQSLSLIFLQRDDVKTGPVQNLFYG